MQASQDSEGSSSPTAIDSQSSREHANLGDEEQGLSGGSHGAPLSTVPSGSGPLPDNDDDVELRSRRDSISSSTGAYLRSKTTQLYEAVTSSSQPVNAPVSPKLAALINSFADSDIAKGLKQEIDDLQRAPQTNGTEGEMRDVAVETNLLRGRKRATWGTQFRILSGRAFKNLYRDPALLFAHYISAIAIACT